jgi:hypothetical protein
MTILLLSVNLLCISLLVNAASALAMINEAFAPEPATSMLVGAALLVGGGILRRRLRRS